MIGVVSKMVAFVLSLTGAPGGSLLVGGGLPGHVGSSLVYAIGLSDDVLAYAIPCCAAAVMSKGGKDVFGCVLDEFAVRYFSHSSRMWSLPIYCSSA